MKKKLLLFLAATLTGLAIYSCARDEDTPYPDVPDPDPLTNEALLRARDFLDFNVGSPVLPNTYLRAGNNASQTRAAEKQSYLYDAIQPDWSQARVWSSDSLTITEVPAQLTRPIRYTVLFENLEDTISYKTQAPYTRIVFNERKGPDTMYCFLVTFLPDESYTGNPALLAGDPSGSDYAGLTIYSHVDGTPAWGWRYDAGEITHTLLFNEEYREQSDPNYSLWIGFGSDEYTTREGIAWTYDASEMIIILPGKKEYVLELINPDKDKIPELKTIGGGGGSGAPGDGGNEKGPPKICPECFQYPCVCHEPEKIPCNDGLTLSANHNYNLFEGMGMTTKFINLYKNKGVEWGATFYYENGQYKMSTPRTDNLPDKVNISYYGNEDRYTVGTVHNHPNGTCHSVQDAVRLGYYHNWTGGQFTSSIVVTPDGTIYCLEIEDSDKAKKFADDHPDGSANAKLFESLHDEALYGGLRHPDIPWNDSWMHAFSYALEARNSGMKLLRLESNGFVQKQAVKNPDNTFKAQTCTY